uniref:Uncharacterized protein n=1 Tax=Eutreptiella gymnastica TaxID=73025 RepID=A0A7S4LNG5_9EUGL
MTSATSRSPVSHMPLFQVHKGEPFFFATCVHLLLLFLIRILALRFPYCNQLAETWNQGVHTTLMGEPLDGSLGRCKGTLDRHLSGSPVIKFTHLCDVDKTKSTVLEHIEFV